MLAKIKKNIGNHLINIPGWRTKRKILIFESDDWGLMRLPSKKVYEKLVANKIDVNLFDKYDSLATEDDLIALYETLSIVKDINGRYPIITSNTVMTNPDYDKIKSNNFSEYFYEYFTETLKKQKNCQNSFNLWQEGIIKGFLSPEYHGREHINVNLWLTALQNDYTGIRLAFDNNTYPSFVNEDVRRHSVRTYDYKDKFEKEYALKSIADGINIFKTIFKFSPKSFMAPAYCWSSSIEKILNTHDINYIQSGRIQYLPMLEEKSMLGIKKIRHFIGRRNELGQIYTIRNIYFEPTLSNHCNMCVNSALKEIDTAFYWHKPAIVSTHRVNFIGSLYEKNRSKSLALFKDLLRRVIQKHPEVEFMASSSLGNYISSSSDPGRIVKKEQ